MPYTKGIQSIVRRAVNSLNRQQQQQVVEPPSAPSPNHDETDTMSSSSQAKHASIDEGLYSRQLYVMGHEAQRRMAGSRVLVYGLNGLGAEICKNVILAGVKSVTLLDETGTTAADLGAHFYLSESDIGKPRAASCITQLAELNNYVDVELLPDGGVITDEAVIKQFDAVVMTQGSLAERVAVNQICHSNGIRFISGQSSGLFCYGFCDFGAEFVVSDPTGEPAKSAIVSFVSNEAKGVVNVHEDSRHGFESGDFVTFSEVQGMTELNGIEPVEIKVTGPFKFELLCDTSKMGKYTHGGRVNQVLRPKTVQMMPLAESLKAPEFVETDFAKFGRSELLHFGFQALDAFAAKHQRSPRPGNDTDGDEVVALVKELSGNAGEGRMIPLDDAAVRCVKALASGASAVLTPMTAFLGGVLAQEVLKACSGKFHPLVQWMYFDAMECLPETDEAEPSEEERKPIGSRYDDQIAVFGKAFVEKLRRQSMFLVGAGAIGCEMIKNCALMGVATEGDAKVHVTDMDTIEKSNLNRQFLFRPKDVGSAKSVAAASAAKEINPALKVNAYEEKVGPDTERVFGDNFMDEIDMVCTALDNINARLYMDQRCLTYGKPMLESGTLGTKGNTQVVVPHLTENYGASRDPPEKSIPICTLKNFPNQIEHTIQFARDWFEGVFAQLPQDANQYITNLQFLAHLEKQQISRVDTLQNLLKSLVTDRPVTFDECIAWARIQFEELFANTIKQLLHNFPPGSKTKDGSPFWTGTKREPVPLVFNLDDPAHLSFIVAAANLRAFNYGLKGETDPAVFRTVLPSVAVPLWRPKNVKIAASNEEAEKMKAEGADAAGASAEVDEALQDVDQLAQSIVEKLPEPKSLAGFKLNPAEFEKDDDTNFHIDFVTAMSNLRARCYRITPEADRHETKRIAGKIIPAIATTTALVTGLVCIELYKLVAGKTKVDSYKNGFVNLALPLFAFSEPVACEKKKAGKWEWSMWDKVVIDGSQGHLTLKEFMSVFTDKYGCEVNLLSFGVSILHSFFQSPKKSAERMVMTMPQLVETVTKKPVDPASQFLSFDVCCVDENDEDVDLPPVFYKMPPVV